MSTDLDENQQQSPEQVVTQTKTQAEGANGVGLEEEAMGEESAAPDIGFAFDADVDRCMVIGAGMTVSPAESLAVITANYKDIPGFSTNAAGLGAVVRSVVTAPAVDRVTESLDIPCVQTPTGWKWLSRATQACVDGGLGARSGGAVLCGEESFGLGSSLLPEKDGIWTSLCWLSVMAKRSMERAQSGTGSDVDVSVVSVREIMKAHWQRFGRYFTARLDFENLDAA
eukprot:gene8739-11213_t